VNLGPELGYLVDIADLDFLGAVSSGERNELGELL
jgi:hypothetical protein